MCFPHVKDYDTATDTEVLADLATYAAGALARKDQENGYWWSPSNTELLGVTGLETPIYAMVNDANSEANLLNEAGIITVFNSYGTGIRQGQPQRGVPQRYAPEELHQRAAHG